MLHYILARGVGLVLTTASQHGHRWHGALLNQTRLDSPPPPYDANARRTCKAITIHWHVSSVF